MLMTQAILVSWWLFKQLVYGDSDFPINGDCMGTTGEIFAYRNSLGSTVVAFLREKPYISPIYVAMSMSA